MRIIEVIEYASIDMLHAVSSREGEGAKVRLIYSTTFDSLYALMA